MSPGGFRRRRGAPFHARVARLPVFFGEVPLPSLCPLLNQIIGEFLLLFVFCLFAVESCGPLTCVGGEPLIGGWLANVLSPSAGGPAAFLLVRPPAAGVPATGPLSGRPPASPRFWLF